MVCLHTETIRGKTLDIALKRATEAVGSESKTFDMRTQANHIALCCVQDLEQGREGEEKRLEVV